MTAGERLRLAAEALPDGASITVPRDALLEALQGQGSADFNVEQLAERFRRSKSTVRSWLEQGLLRGYRFRRKEWRVTSAAVAEFEASEREGRPPRRATRGKVANLGAWRDHPDRKSA